MIQFNSQDFYQCHLKIYRLIKFKIPCPLCHSYCIRSLNCIFAGAYGFMKLVYMLAKVVSSEFLLIQEKFTFPSKFK